MLVHIIGAKCIGIDAVPVTVEVEMTAGIGIHLVGLADVAVKESLLRTITALDSVSFQVPGKKIVINLAPADLRKSGSGYDLPIAVGIIAASGRMELPGIADNLVMGELGLNSEVRPIPGALPMAELALRSGLKGVILPYESALEAVDLGGPDIYGVRNLEEVLRILRGEPCEDLLVRAGVCPSSVEKDAEIPDFADIVGQENAKRALEIAAAGNHNIILLGSPGSGKSSLAKALPGILPPMSPEESLLTSKIYSVSGKGSSRRGLVRTRPFRAPHCSASLSAMIGGGGGDGIVPGEVSLAQGGVLFLDEFIQMPKSVVEALRAPLEDRKVSISRLHNKLEFPASFMLVAAANPCPCGYYGDSDRCVCTPVQRLNYISRLSGPIMDRIDLQVRMGVTSSSDLLEGRRGEPSAAVAARVGKARAIQAERFVGEGIFTNAEMNNRQIERHCPLDAESREFMRKLMEGLGLSMRAFFRVIRVARTIADLAGEEAIRPQHLAEAAGYRFLDKAPGYQNL